jgi:hypothetical protein
MRRVALLLVVLAAAGCAGEDEPERELVPGSRVVIGVVGDERLVFEGARVEANRLNNAGGIGGALLVTLRRGTVEELVDARVRLLILPCHGRVYPDARRAQQRGAVAVAPCDDTGLIGRSVARAFPTSLAPGQQAEALVSQAGGKVGGVLAPANDVRSRYVHRLLAGVERGGSAVVSPDAIEHVTPPAGAPEGTFFATYGFPEPGSRVDEFYERFKAVYARRPESIVAALASDSLTVLAKAIEIAASTQPRFVVEAFREGFDVRGVLSEVEYDGKTTRPDVEATILQLNDGRLRVAG